MDLSAPNLDLLGGLDIQGKLVFPDRYKLTLKAPYVRVQGELQMTSTKIPNGEPDVKIVLTGTDEELTKFIPADSNSEACADDDCSVGKKPIVVAGGKLNIQALPTRLSTWVNLYDIATNSTAASLLPGEYGYYKPYEVPPIRL